MALFFITVFNIHQVTSSRNLPIYSPNKLDDRERIRLGYMTGSENKAGDMFYQKPGQVISGAITLAVDEINADPNILPNHTLEILIAETMGQETESIRLAAILPSFNISAYIGPQETCVHEGRIAAAFNLPMISYVSISSLLIAMFPLNISNFYCSNQNQLLTWPFNTEQCSTFALFEVRSFG